jgi:acetyl esterase/lipase
MARALRLFFVAFFRVLFARLRRGPLVASWSFPFETMVRYLRLDWDETAAWDLARMRADSDARPYPRKLARRVPVRDEMLGGVPVRWFEPEGAPSDRAILFFHGGSYIYGSARTSHAELVAGLALLSGRRVVAPDYRLAPEHPFPAQIDDAVAVLSALEEGGLAASRIVAAGDSAGGNLAIELALRLRDEGKPQLAGLVLVSPWSDLRMPGRSFVENEPYDFGTRDVLVRHREAFAPGMAYDDPRLSPVCADLARLPPTLVTVGDREIPRDDILALAEALRRAGVDTTLHVAPDMPHNAPVWADVHPSGKAALEACARFAAEHLPTSTA